MATIQLTDEMLSGVMSTAVLNALSQADRETLIRGAIEHLLTPEKTGYHPGKSPLVAAFNAATEYAARKIVEKELGENPAFQSQVKALLAEAVERTVGDPANREKLVERIGAVVRQALTGDRY